MSAAGDEGGEAPSWQRPEWESYVWLFFALLVVLGVALGLVDGLGGNSSWWSALLRLGVAALVLPTLLAHTRWFWRLGRYRIFNPTSWEDVRAGRRRY
jgi:hypothetical protein